MSNTTKAQDDSDEEDYMSDAFLAKWYNNADTKVSLVPDRIAKQYKKEKLHVESNRIHKEQNKSVRQLESETREEGLKNALSSENKGFLMLQKMGYKPGTAIGKKGIGKVEPVGIEIKTGRGGLGQELDRKRRQDARVAMHAEMARKRMRHEAEWRNEVKSKFAEREIEKDLLSSQRVCHQLDEEQEIEEPSRQFFWPADSLNYGDEVEDDEEEEEEEKYDDDNEDNDETYDDEYNANKRKSNPMPSDDVLNSEDLRLTTSDKLRVLTQYLRTTYLYCTWCGTKFEDANDLQTNCPGDNADAHS